MVPRAAFRFRHVAANKVLGAGGSWVSANILQRCSRSTQQSAGYTILAADKNCIVSLTGSSCAETFAFTAPPATLGSGWFCYLYNNSTAALTLTPGSSVTRLTGLTSYIMYPWRGAAGAMFRHGVYYDPC